MDRPHEHPNSVACGLCEGLGYRSDSRRTAVATEDLEVCRVLAYDGTMGAVKVYLEETLAQGDQMLVVTQGRIVEFVVDHILVAGMQLTMALRGWEVTLLVPQALQPGDWIIRK